MSRKKEMLHLASDIGRLRKMVLRAANEDNEEKFDLWSDLLARMEEGLRKMKAEED